MDSLPFPILAQICLYLPQQDLACLAATCRILQPLAMDALYRKVSVVVGASRPLNRVDLEIIRQNSGGLNGSLVLDLSSAALLLQALERNADLVKHFSYEAPEATEMQTRFVKVLRNLRLKTFHMDPPVRPVGTSLTHTSVFSMDQLDTAVSTFTSVNIELKEEALESHHINAPTTLQNLSCASRDLQGLAVLSSIDTEEKLQLTSLSISHLHNHGEPLAFDAIANSIDIPQLSKLRLTVDCHQVGCPCYGAFFSSFTALAAENDGLPALEVVEVEAFPQEDWLRPVEMLEQKLEPLSNFLQQLTGLVELKLDFATPCLKMTGDSETSVSDARKINRRLVDAFFLSMFEKPDFGLRLRKLELPDFLASFAYYKSDFNGSMLQTCQCQGCHDIIEELSQKVLDEIALENPEVDESQALFLVMYAVLHKLQNEKRVLLGDNARFSLSLLKADSSDWIAEHFSSCTVSELALKTYIAHQLEPMKQYFSVIFENLLSLNLHGVYFEKGEEMGSVFHHENYT